MEQLSYAEIQEQLRSASLESLPRLGISVLRNATVEPIEPYLCYLAWRAGLRAEVRFGRYDNILQDATDPSSELWEGSADAVLVFARLEELCPDLCYRFPALDADDVRAEIERVRGFAAATLRALRGHSRAAVLWHGFETPAHPAFGIHDSQSDAGQLRAVRDLNDALRQTLRDDGDAYFVDLDLGLARVGAERFYDPRTWHIGRAPYSREGLREIAEEDFKYVRALRGQAKKCLVLDCDNVLWGGVVGEDGLEGIQLAPDYPGSPYYEFQREARALYERGVILALCSKNNEDDVWQVFREHPHMILSEEHIAAARVNWDDKATNLTRIAKDLNIGLDSLVFVDDSEFEVGLVRETLPEVEVIHLPKAHAVRARELLASCGWFDTLTLSEEDRQRGLMYKAEARRRELETTTDLATYLRSLEMRACIRLVDGATVPRVAQLTQRTNQFNLTTRRYSEADIVRLEDASDSDVLYVRLADRFGDYGIVGAAILRHGVERPDRSEIDTLLLSCRVIGRGVEDAFLSACLELARQRGAASVCGRYAPTRKNRLVRDFYPERGFAMESDEGEETIYAFDLSERIPLPPDHLEGATLDARESAA